MFPALALFDQIGPRRSQFGAHAFQRLHIAGPAHLQGLVLRSRQAQCVALALLGVGSLATRAEIAGELVLQNGTQAQKDRWLKPLATGEVWPMK